MGAILSGIVLILYLKWVVYIIYFSYKMTTIGDLIDEAVDDLGLTSTQVSAASWLKYFNRSLHRIENNLVRFLKDNYFREYSKWLNTVVSQSVYDLPGGDASGPDSGTFPMFKKLLQLTVQYGTALAPVKAKQIDYSSLDFPLSWYATNQPIETPTYIIFWTWSPLQVQIFPTPTVAVTNGITIDYEASMQDYVAADDVNVIPLDWQYHFVIEYGIQYRINKKRKWVGSPEANAAKVEFESAMNSLLSEMSDRLIRPQFQDVQIPTFMMR